MVHREVILAVLVLILISSGCIESQTSSSENFEPKIEVKAEWLLEKGVKVYPEETTEISFRLSEKGSHMINLNLNVNVDGLCVSNGGAKEVGLYKDGVLIESLGKMGSLGGDSFTYQFKKISDPELGTYNVILVGAEKPTGDVIGGCDGDIVSRYKVRATKSWEEKT